jgi:CHASE2 domain-containing sensor protein
MAWLGHFKQYENLLTDFLQSITYKKAKDVTLLFITEDEYKRGFNSISPLSRERLADTIEMLVKLKARVIALDIDISDSTSEDHKLSDVLARASTAGVPVIVTGNFTKIDEQDPSVDNPHLERPYAEERLSFTEDGFVLFADVGPGRQWIGKVMYGGVDFRLDPDGILRRAEPLYMIKDASYKNSQRPIPSLPVTVAAAYLGMSEKDLENALSNIHDNNITLSGKGNHYQHDIYIHIGRDGRITPNFIGNYEHFDREVSLTRLFEDYGPGKAEGMTIFRDKVVIIGGTYDKKDFYMTPVGMMSGMEILANITQNILSHNLITHTNRWKAFAIEVFLGTLVALAFILMSRFWATVICLVSLMPVVTAASIISFAASYYWFDFIPTISGVVLHGWISKTEKDIKAMKYKLKKR